MKKRMALLDSGFLRMERHESPQHGTILVIFKMPDDAPPDYMQQLATRMREFPVTRERFNWRLSTSLLDAALPAWEMLAPEQIELDYHFRHSALPQPGGELELALVVSRLATHPVDLHRPPWEVHLIEGLENGRFALFVKMHHSLIDGVSTVKMIRSWLSDDPAQTGTPPLWATANAGQPDATRPSETRRPEGSVLGSMLAIGKSIRSISGAAGKTIAAAVSDVHRRNSHRTARRRPSCGSVGSSAVGTGTTCRRRTSGLARLLMSMSCMISSPAPTPAHWLLFSGPPP